MDEDVFLWFVDGLRMNSVVSVEVTRSIKVSESRCPLYEAFKCILEELAQKFFEKGTRGVYII